MVRIFKGHVLGAYDGFVEVGLEGAVFVGFKVLCFVVLINLHNPRFMTAILFNLEQCIFA